MVALTAVPSLHYLLSSERLEFFRSVAAVVTFTSNFFFWLQSGYFDHAAVEKPLLHTWSLAVEEQFYLALPVVLWVMLRFVRIGRIALAVALGAMALVSFALCLWLMHTERSANAFFMSPPRAWEFLIGGLVATPGLPVLRNARAQQIARGIALVLLAIPIFSLRPGPGFPGVNALLPCIGAAVFIWSGIGVATQIRSPHSHHSVIRFFGQISYSLYLWHWPLFTFARFSKTSLVLDPLDKIALFALTVAISYLSWRCRTAVSPGVAGAGKPRRVSHGGPCDDGPAGRQRGRNHLEPDAVGCRSRRNDAGYLQQLRGAADLSRGLLLPL
jgi:peptidoglycan/LPS O-acetylase OafA/YrhL